jgi:hypothetical protein
MKAKRGDLAVTVIVTGGLDGQTPARTDVRVTHVTSVTRAGHVKEVCDVGVASTPYPIWNGLRPPGSLLYIASASEVDVIAVLDAARAHHYPGHLDQPMGYSDLYEVLEMVCTHRKETTQGAQREGRPASNGRKHPAVRDGSDT